MDKYLTKYEKARILGIRSIQLNNGAKPMVNVGNLKSVYEIAEKELMEYKCPLTIRRKYPDGTYVDLRVSELILD